MINVNKDIWGPLDAAEEDPDFEKKFVRPSQVEQALDRSNWIVTGTKGSGKTAIMQHFTILDNQDGPEKTIAAINFDNSNFEALYQHIKSLIAVTKVDPLICLSSFWQFFILSEGVRALIRDNPDEEDLRKIAKPFISDEKKNGPFEQLLGQLSKIWGTIDEITSPTEVERIIPADLISRLAEGALTPEVVEHRNHFIKWLRDNNRNLRVVLDGFDRVRMQGHSKESLSIVFGALMDAVYQLRLHLGKNSPLSIKALLPHDRLQRVDHRDRVKIDGISCLLSWNYDSLQEFLLARLKLDSRLRYVQSFDQAWREFMPASITNGTYQVSENSYEYILRHTMYVPRHFQVILWNLCVATSGRTIAPADVPKCVRECETKLFEYWIDEYHGDCVDLRSFCKAFMGKQNVLRFSEFRRIVEKATSHLDSAWKPEDAVDWLYSASFFGVVHKFTEEDLARGRVRGYCPPARDGFRYQVLYFHKDKIGSVSRAIDDDDMVAVHPIFTHPLRLQAHSEIIAG